MSKTSSSSSGGIGFFGLLAIVFIVLKLGGWTAVATWSWVWVLAPLWGGFLFSLAVMFVVFTVYALVAAKVGR